MARIWFSYDGVYKAGYANETVKRYGSRSTDELMDLIKNEGLDRMVACDGTLDDSLIMELHRPVLDIG